MSNLPQGMSILRIFRARARPGREGQLAEKLRSTSTPLVKEQPALLGFVAGGPIAPGGREFVFATLWQSFGGMKALFGEEWRASLLPEGYAELIESCSVEHYELTDGSPWPVPEPTTCSSGSA